MFPPLGMIVTCCGQWQHSMDAIAYMHIGPLVSDWPVDEMMASVQLFSLPTPASHWQQHIWSTCSFGPNCKSHLLNH